MVEIVVVFLRVRSPKTGLRLAGSTSGGKAGFHLGPDPPPLRAMWSARRAVHGTPTLSDARDRGAQPIDHIADPRVGQQRHYYTDAQPPLSRHDVNQRALSETDVSAATLTRGITVPSDKFHMTYHGTLHRHILLARLQI